ncbi:MAG: Ig domain-containing protein [Terracidiphilus sp.]|jgi:hypothetical protein
MGIGLLPFSSADTVVEHSCSRAFLATAALFCGVIAGCGGGAKPPAPPSNLVYPQTTISATAGTAIQADTPTVTGTVTSFTVSPTLPAGLSLNASTGAISGVPTVVTAQASYTVTATNSSGSTMATVTITVNPAAPSNLVYPQTSISAETGVAIQADTPTVTGTVSGYTVSPALPAGLNLEASTGTISGTPTVVTTGASYTVTASNVSGSTTATVTIAVVLGPPLNLSYAQPNISAPAGTAIQPDTPTVTGTVSGYTVSPPLPAGLALDPATGIISGAPAIQTAQATYTVTAGNSAGSTTAQISISVTQVSTTLLELGHGNSISYLAETSDRVLSEDSSGHWNLWNYTSGNILVSGDGAATTPGAGVAMAGQVAAITTPTAIEVISPSDGHLLFTIPATFAFDTPVSWQLAVDGSYICLGTASGLTVWSAAGNAEFTLSGNYSSAAFYAGPNQLEIANGAAGANVIQTVSVPGGTSSDGPAFSGSFGSWFSDGSGFTTVTSTTVSHPSGPYTYPSAVSSYSSASVLLNSVSVSSPYLLSATGGAGNWLWTVDWELIGTGADVLKIYQGANPDPVETYDVTSFSTYQPSGTTIDIYNTYGYPQVTTVDLSGSAPVLANYATPNVAYVNALAANSLSQWVVGDRTGAILDGASVSTTPRYFGYGEALDMAAAGNLAAIATASGQILLYDVTGPTQEGSIGLLADNLAMSSDGSVLGAFLDDAIYAQYEPDRTLNFYSLPSLTTISSFPSNYNDPSYLQSFSLSGSGTTIGQVMSAQTREVTGISGTPTIWSDTGVDAPILLSPDGTEIAVADYTLLTLTATAESTSIYKNGALVTTVPGYAEGWIDNDRLLVANMGTSSGQIVVTFLSSAIYSSSGTQLATFTSSQLPQMSNPQSLGSNLVYDSASNAVYSLTTGTAIWQGPVRSFTGAAIAGPYVVYPSGHQVVLYPY